MPTLTAGQSQIYVIPAGALASVLASGGFSYATVIGAVLDSGSTRYVSSGQTATFGPFDVAVSLSVDCNGGNATVTADARSQPANRGPYGVSSVNGMVERYSMPAPLADAADNFALLYDFAQAMPAGAIITAPAGALYIVAAGWQSLKAGQRWDFKRSTFKRPTQTTATTTTTVASGATFIGLNSVAGLYPGKFVSVFGPNGSAVACRYNYVTRITKVVATGVYVEPLLNSVIRTDTGAAGQTLAVGATLHDAGWQLGNNYDMVRAYTAWAGTEADFWNTQVTRDVELTDAILDGSSAAFLSGRRWETVAELSCVGHDFQLNGLQYIDVPGEAAIVSGKAMRIDRMRGVGLNGNGIHLSAFTANYGCHDTLISAPYIESCCLVDIGHSDGGITASNNVYKTKIRDGIIRTSVKGGVCSWDSADNQELDCRGMTFEALTGGAIKAKASASANIQMKDIVFSDNTIRACGLSAIGGDYSQASNNSTAIGVIVGSNKFYDSPLLATGLIGGSISDNEFQMTAAAAMFTVTASAIPNGKVMDLPSLNGTKINDNRVYMPAYIGSAVNANAASYGIHVYGQSVDVLKSVDYRDNYTFGGMVGQYIEGGQGGNVSHTNVSEDAAVIGYVAAIGSGQKTIDSRGNVVRLSVSNSQLNGTNISGGHRAIVYANNSTTAWLLANKDRVEVLTQSGVGTYIIGFALATGRVKGDGCHAQMYSGNTRPWEFSSGITGAPATNVAYWENATRNVSDSGAGAPAGATLTNNRLLP